MTEQNEQPLPPRTIDFRPHAEELRTLAQTWTQSSLFARLDPDGIAVIAPHGQRTFAQLHAHANRLSNWFRAHGLVPGDAVALLCRNRAEFIEVLLATLRSGLRLTPINSHITHEEARYIVQDCGARALVVEDSLDAPCLAFDGLCRLVIDGVGPENYAEGLAGSDVRVLQPPQAGTLMLYTSGTTGRPKGVFSGRPDVVEPQFAGTLVNYRPGDMAMCCGPAYHAAPLLSDIRWPLASGVPILMIEKWDSQQVLKLMAQHRVSHAHMVPTMFQRLLALEPTIRTSFDLSALRFLVHGAAPCPVELKRAMIDWVGPVLYEYYAATEGGNDLLVDSHQWLLKPGTVGQVNPALGTCILDDSGQEVGPGVIGRVYFAAPAVGRFEYYRDPEKTAATYEGNRFTLGDMGYVDADGFLFLTGRAAECIISGGVNIYPVEVDQTLLRHPAVREICTVGAPDDEWGERVVAVVVVAPGYTPNHKLAAELTAFAAQHLARFKCPRQIVFDTALPQTATGKLLRNQVRQRFWQGRDKAI
ncbi:AMP-binding protein [Roseateles sp.]|jgi:long-chain acyl-CoA synthetase|uniref:AMP-binding protein n=1 Tax=Roseateles sp. TaxID=1971397 RepID=UPI0037C83B84